MVAPPSLILMVVTPVASLTVATVLAPVTSRAAAIVACVMPFPFTSMTLLPFSALPIATPIVVPVAIPARANDHSGRRFDIHRRRRSVDRLWCIRDTGDADAYSNIDVRQGDRGYAYADAGNQRHREPAIA